MGIEVFIAKSVAEVFAGDGYLAREPEGIGDVGEAHFAESDFRGLNSEADIRARGEKVGADAEDLGTVLVDPSDALDQQGHNPKLITYRVDGDSALGLLSEGHNVGITRVDLLIAEIFEGRTRAKMGQKVNAN